jgi:membrane protease YdiL (CAAX protease family)
LPLLWAWTLYCVWLLARSGKLNALSVTPAGLLQQLPSILSLFVLFALSTTALMYRYASRELFGFARVRPMLWVLFMVGYPILSVYPQGIIYRAFFFERYQSLFPRLWLMILMSALAFAYMHIVFRNWIALALTLLGGFIFAIRYAHTGSLFISCFEHSLYGGWLFTVGLGRWFVYDERLTRLISAQGSDAPLVFP